MVELNPVNVKVCKRIFNMIDPDVTPNIYNNNFLSGGMKLKRVINMI